MAKKQPTLPEPAPVPVPGKPYQIVGLQLADQMPIHFEGRQYDLANLSDEELTYLLDHAAQVPYLKRID